MGSGDPCQAIREAIVSAIPVDAGRLCFDPIAETSVNTHAFDRLSFVAGIAAAALFLVGTGVFIGVIVPDLPPIHAPAAERAEFYAAMARNTVYRSISYLGELQMVLLLLFFGGLYGVLRRAEGGSGAMSMSVFGAGVTLAVITPLIILIEDHLMLGFARAGVDPVVTASIDGLGPLSFALGGFPQAVVAGGTAALLLRQRAVPRALGWFGVVLAVMSLAGTGTLMRGALFPVSSLTMILFRIWLLALSVVLLRHVGRSAVAEVGVDALPPPSLSSHLVV